MIGTTGLAGAPNTNHATCPDPTQASYLNPAFSRFSVTTALLPSSGLHTVLNRVAVLLNTANATNVCRS